MRRQQRLYGIEQLIAGEQVEERKRIGPSGRLAPLFEGHPGVRIIHERLAPCGWLWFRNLTIPLESAFPFNLNQLALSKCHSSQTPLRQTMIQAMCQHGFSPRTQHSYLYVVTALKVKDIDSERHLLQIEQGKGAKDRMVPLAPGLLQALRRYWRIRHPMLWLFPSDLLPDRHLHITTPQKVYHTAKTASGIEKRGGIHALRHAYATHQLERGLPIHELQRLLGHSDLRSTQRYLHWLPGVTPQNGGPVDLIASLGGA